MTKQAAPLLSVDGLTISSANATVVDAISFSVARGKTLAVVGESGSGKTLTSLSLLGLLPPGVSVSSGRVSLDGNPVDLRDSRTMAGIRGRRISLSFQDASASLNPTFTIGTQLERVILNRQKMRRHAARAEALDLLRLVELRDPAKVAASYPFEVSGGMRQRSLLAMALACRADLLIADEPTTALDTIVQSKVVDLIRRLQLEQGFGMIFISHDIRLVRRVADDVLVLYRGKCMEYGPAEDVFRDPKSPYTRALIACVPDAQRRPERLKTVSDYFEKGASS